MAMDLPPLLEIAHVAHRLRVSPAFVRSLIHSGKLIAIRVGKRWRIDEADLKRYTDAQRPPHARRHGDGTPTSQLQQRTA